VTTHVERSIEVAVPVRAAYDQWTRFEEFPRFMSGVEEVRQVGDAMTHWVAQIAGVRREWDAEIVAQVPDEKVAWAATTGATNAGAVFFDEVGADRTRVRLTLEFEPEGLVERIGDVLDIVDRQAVADLDRFKEFIEGQGSAAGGWRDTSEDGGVMSQEAQGQAMRQTAEPFERRLSRDLEFDELVAERLQAVQRGRLRVIEGRSALPQEGFEVIDERAVAARDLAGGQSPHQRIPPNFKASSPPVLPLPRESWSPGALLS